jgi:nucleoside-diphosphate-sugar epimerase
MKLLFLGGTRFVGLHMVQVALDRGHEVTLFNRGKYNPTVFPQLESIKGERDGGLDALRGRQWDSVIDVSGWVPRHVHDSATMLRDNVGHYCYISTLSVYADLTPRLIGEDEPLGQLDDESIEEVTSDTYGPLKALCERKADEAMPGRVLHLRPGIVVGPSDYTDRFTYWPRRVSQGGEVLVPGKGQEPVRYIDGRDLALFTIKMVEEGQTGAYNCIGPKELLTMRAMLEECNKVTNSAAELTWVDAEFIKQQTVMPSLSLPFWYEPNSLGHYMFDNSKANAAGMIYRPLSQTISELLAWDNTRHKDEKKNTGLQPEEEKALLQAWREWAG